MKRILPALAATLLALTLSGCGGSSNKAEDTTPADSGSSATTEAAAADLPLITAGTLTVCSDVPYPPFEDFDSASPTGFKGFDVDIVSKVAEGLGLKVAIKDSSFDALQSGLALNSGQCDMAASAMTITDDRKKALDFSDGYYDSEQSLLVPNGSEIATLADLAGKKVGVQQGTTGKAYTEKNAADAEIITFPSDAEMYQAIKAGQVDALLQDLPVNVEHAKDGNFTVAETYSTGEMYGLAMKKGSTALVDAVNGELTKMRDDGTYQTIYDTYFTAK